jgi:hypothetical protein
MGGWLFNPEVVGPFAQPSLIYNYINKDKRLSFI